MLKAITRIKSNSLSMKKEEKLIKNYIRKTNNQLMKIKTNLNKMEIK